MVIFETRNIHTLKIKKKRQKNTINYTYSEGNIMTSTDSVALQTRNWPSDKMTYHFAKQDQGILPATPNTGVCFSGDRRPETDG